MCDRWRQKYKALHPTYFEPAANPYGVLEILASEQQIDSMAERGVNDSVVSAAVSHAAAIRRTLWVQEYKRTHGRAIPSSAGAIKSPTGVSGHKPLEAEDTPPVLAGPIYSTEYWRAWKSRSRAGIRAVRRNNCQPVSDPT